MNLTLFRTPKNSARCHHAKCRSAQSRGSHQRRQVPAPNRRRSDLSSDRDDKRPKNFRERKKPGPGTKEENWKRTISRAGPWRSRGWRSCLMNGRSWVRFPQPQIAVVFIYRKDPRSFFFIFFFSIFKVQMVDKNFPMLRFEPRISGVGSNHSTNWATTTALNSCVYLSRQKMLVILHSLAT